MAFSYDLASPDPQRRYAEIGRSEGQGRATETRGQEGGDALASSSDAEVLRLLEGGRR